MKKVLIELVNEELSEGSNAEIGLKLSDLVSQSLHWWHSQLGDSDKLKLDGWRISSIEVTESPAKSR
jgi:hypothetical protein